MRTAVKEWGIFICVSTDRLYQGYTKQAYTQHILVESKQLPLSHGLRRAEWHPQPIEADHVEFCCAFLQNKEPDDVIYHLSYSTKSDSKPSQIWVFKKKTNEDKCVDCECKKFHASRRSKDVGGICSCPRKGSK